MIRKFFHICILVIICLGLSSALEQCKVTDQGKDVREFECTGSTPYCCDNGSENARCCQKKHNALLSLSLTALGVFTVVFAAMMCAGCGPKKDETPAGSPAEVVATGVSQIGSPEAEQGEAKKSNMDLKSNTGSKIGKSKLDSNAGTSSMDGAASAISAIDSKRSNIAGSTIDSKASNIGSKISGTGSTIGSAIDSKASGTSSTGSSLDSKLSGTGSTVGTSNLGTSNLDSRASQVESKAGSSMGSRLESRASSAVGSKAGSSMGSSLDNKSNISSKASGTSKTN